MSAGPDRFLKGTQINNAKDFRGGPAHAPQQRHQLLIDNVAKRPGIRINRANLPNDRITRCEPGRRQRHEGAPCIAQIKFQIEWSRTVPFQFRCKGYKTVRMPVGVEPRVEWRLVVKFSRDIRTVNACPVAVELCFTAMTTQFHGLHMAVRI